MRRLAAVIVAFQLAGCRSDPCKFIPPQDKLNDGQLADALHRRDYVMTAYWARTDGAGNPIVGSVQSWSAVAFDGKHCVAEEEGRCAMTPCAPETGPPGRMACDCRSMVGQAAPWENAPVWTCELSLKGYRLQGTREYRFDDRCRLSEVRGTFRGCYVDTLARHAYESSYHFEVLGALGNWRTLRIEVAEEALRARLPVELREYVDEDGGGPTAGSGFSLGAFRGNDGVRVFGRVPLEVLGTARRADPLGPFRLDVEDAKVLQENAPLCPLLSERAPQWMILDGGI